MNITRKTAETCDGSGQRGKNRATPLQHALLQYSICVLVCVHVYSFICCVRFCMRVSACAGSSRLFELTDYIKLIRATLTSLTCCSMRSCSSLLWFSSNSFALALLLSTFRMTRVTTRIAMILYPKADLLVLIKLNVNCLLSFSVALLVSSLDVCFVAFQLLCYWRILRMFKLINCTGGRKGGFSVFCR